jgi:hydrogenase maturation protein HypF
MNTTIKEKKDRLRIRVYGIVQGVGFRPFVARIAGKTGISGSVCNKGSYVEIFVEGTNAQLTDFTEKLTQEAPERSQILKVETQSVSPAGDTTFKIIQSEKVKGEVFVSPDIAICPKCREELFDKNNRRYLHPFINCTACGPRLTILESMPYDRVRTSMGEFPMCPQCEYEYTHEETRRYHAQPVCCNDCGPHLYIPGRSEQNAAALVYVRDVIRNGGIAAIKGIGGFHLCCDAANNAAVARLRSLKNRPFKPFAVMMKDCDTVRRECAVLDGQEQVLDGPRKPILLLERKRETGVRLCEGIAPGNPDIGVMLPYAPVQLLLFSYPDGKEMTDCFVMTSGNPPGAPICRTDEDALAYLSPLCDVILSNNRTIRLRADDSVMAWLSGKPYMIRRSRGYAPLPFMLSGTEKGCVLGIGGELKNTFCLTGNNLYYLSPYIGDLADVRSVAALKEGIARMKSLLELVPSAVACDMHPDYNSTHFARTLGLPVIEVQHHYAHIVSCMAENDFPGDVIGVAFDGTGYGTDRTIWGGEFLHASYDGFLRLGSIAPFIQAGGDSSAKEGWRIAVSLLLDDGIQNTAVAVSAAERCALILQLGLCDERMLAFQRTMIANRINCVTSTSMGRVFDAVSAILGLKKCSSFEGEASMALEFAAEAELRILNAETAAAFISGNGIIYRRKINEFYTGGTLLVSGRIPDGRFLLNTTDLVWRIAARKADGVPDGLSALAFHAIISDMIVAGCCECREETGCKTAALSGGVMQNLLLVNMCRQRLELQGFAVLTHSLVPANDGGIALGQAAVAMRKIGGDCR